MMPDGGGRRTDRRHRSQEQRAMGTIEGIRKHGFRKWYERQLVESHVWLVTMLLSIIMMASGFELLTVKESVVDLVYDALLVVSGAAISWYSWRRYATTMLVAEYVGHQAVCPSCTRYGFRPVPVSEQEGPARPLQLIASCRRCGHRWPIDPGV
jgi:hypothetical protein